MGKWYSRILTSSCGNWLPLADGVPSLAFPLVSTYRTNRWGDGILSGCMIRQGRTMRLHHLPPSQASQRASLPNVSGKEGATRTFSGWPWTMLTAHISHSALFQVAALARLLNFNPGKGGHLKKETHIKDCAGGPGERRSSCDTSFSSLSAPSSGREMQALSVRAETVCRFIIASHEEGKGFYLKALEATISISIFDHVLGIVLGVLHKLSN